LTASGITVGSTITVQTKEQHNIQAATPGTQIAISGAEQSGYNGTYTVSSVTSFNTFHDTTSSKGDWITVFHSIKLSDINIRDKNLRLKIGIWNVEKEKFLLDDIIIKCRDGNPYLYGLTEDYYKN
jgi:hypothetical protein